MCIKRSGRCIANFSALLCLTENWRIFFRPSSAKQRNGFFARLIVRHPEMRIVSEMSPQKGK